MSLNMINRAAIYLYIYLVTAVIACQLYQIISSVYIHDIICKYFAESIQTHIFHEVTKYSTS